MLIPLLAALGIFLTIMFAWSFFVGDTDWMDGWKVLIKRFTFTSIAAVVLTLMYFAIRYMMSLL